MNAFGLKPAVVRVQALQPYCITISKHRNINVILYNMELDKGNRDSLHFYSQL